MKLKHLLLAVCAFSAVTGLAQRKTMTVDTSIVGTDYPIPVKKTYSYVIDEEGNQLKDGPYSISGRLVNERLSDGWRTLTFSGSYNLTTGFKKGALHGPFNFNYQMTARQSNGTVETSSAVYAGTMVDGYPHGAFNATHKWTGGSNSLRANYKNGILVGSYYVNTWDGKCSYTYQGVLTQNGELNGVWNLTEMAEKKVYTFVNGILTNWSNSQRAMKPAMATLAQKYAAKQITEEELAKQNIYIVEDSLALGQLAISVIFKDEKINWDDLGFYKFGKRRYTRYKELVELLSFSPEGFEKYKEYCVQLLNKAPERKLHQTHSSANIPCATVDKESGLFNYVKGPINQNRWKVEICLSDEQVQALDSLAPAARKAAIKHLPELLGDQGAAAISDTTALYKLTLKELKQLQKNVEGIILRAANGHEIASEQLICAGTDLYAKEEIGQLHIFSKQVDRALATQYIKLGQMEAAAKYADRSQFATGLVDKCLTAMLNNKARSVSGYGGMLGSMVTGDSGSPIAKYVSYQDAYELHQHIAPFCILTAYKIIEVRGEQFDEVVCHLTVQGKKSRTNYELVLRINQQSKKIDLNSFDVSKAKKIL